jgi:hypothetical protein
MPVDPTGTTPGLVGTPEPETVLQMRCKNQNCDSIQVREIKSPMPTNVRRYQCVKCQMPFGVAVGGSVDF